MYCPPGGSEGKIRGDEGDVWGCLVGVMVERFSSGCVSAVEDVEVGELVDNGITPAVGSLGDEPSWVVGVEVAQDIGTIEVVELVDIELEVVMGGGGGRDVYVY